MKGLIQMTIAFGLLSLTNGKVTLGTDELDLLERLTDDLVERMEHKQVDATIQGPGMTSSEQMRAFKAPGKRMLRRLEETNQEIDRINTQVDALFLASGGKDGDLLRELHDLELSTRALPDKHCSLTMNCNEIVLVDGKEFRTANGSCNNLFNTTTARWGMAGQQHQRWVPDAYVNHKWKPRQHSARKNEKKKVDLPSARTISNNIHKYTKAETPASSDLSVMAFQFGQFIDHDIVRTPEGSVGKKNCCAKFVKKAPFCMPITVPAGDADFVNELCMDVRRSFTVLTCEDGSKLQNQINELTAWIDASNVYGSSDEETDDLRTFNGGRMKTSTSDMLPENANTVCDETGPEKDNGFMCFKAGDARANVFPGLTTLHTVFVRLHNIIAEELGTNNVAWNDARIFQETRKIIGALMQKITFSEWLPKIMSAAQLDKHRVTTQYEYDDQINADIFQAFSLAFRFGHSLLPGKIGFSKASASSAFLEKNSEDVWNKPSNVMMHNYKAITELSQWMHSSPCRHADRFMEESARSNLFKDENGSRFDLAALNIMRGYDWGTPSFPVFRDFCGIPSGTNATVAKGSAKNWDDLTTTHSPETIALLNNTYSDPRDVDLFTGVVTEEPETDSLVGQTTACLLGKQFARLKHGDRFWYENSQQFTTNQLSQINMTKFSKILCETLGIETIPEDVFLLSSGKKTCQELHTLDLAQWTD